MSPRDTWRSSALGTSMLHSVVRCMPMLHNNVYKLTKVYANDTWHQYAQEYLPLAYYYVNT